MTIILDPVMEEKLQEELVAGRYRDPIDLIAHALELVKAERAGITVRRAAFFAEVEESIAQADRGEVFTEDQVRARMAAFRAAHPLPQTN